MSVIGDQVAAEAARWIGTPFRPHAAARGAGADCVGFVLGVYQASGLLSGVVAGSYSIDAWAHARHSQLDQWMEREPRFERLDGLVMISPGDVIAFRIGRFTHHVGIAVSRGRFMHAMKGAGVVEQCLAAPWIKRVASIYRWRTP